MENPRSVALQNSGCHCPRPPGPIERRRFMYETDDARQTAGWPETNTAPPASVSSRADAAPPHALRPFR